MKWNTNEIQTYALQPPTSFSEFRCRTCPPKESWPFLPSGEVSSSKDWDNDGERNEGESSTYMIFSPSPANGQSSW